MSFGHLIKTFIRSDFTLFVLVILHLSHHPPMHFHPSLSLGSYFSSASSFVSWSGQWQVWLKRVAEAGRSSSPLPSCLGPQSGSGSGSPFRAGSHWVLRKGRSRYSFQLPVFTNPWATSASLVSSPKPTHTSLNNSFNALQNHIWLYLLFPLGPLLKWFYSHISSRAIERTG